MPSFSGRVAEGIGLLEQADPVLGRVIARVGPMRLRLERDRFRMLFRSILSQQISLKAARSIRERVEQLVAPEGINPASLAALSIEQLRGAGVSGPKARYLHDLAQKVRDREVRLDRLGRMSDDEVIAELCQVHGVGEWTAQMALIFSLGRLDVLPHADYGLRSALQRLYGLDELPSRSTCHEIAQPWRPYATIASWYCWRSLEIKDLISPTWEFPG